MIKKIKYNKLKINNESQVKPIIDEINNLLEKTNYDNLVTTRGVFKGKIVIQVGVTKKDEALTVIEKLIGVPRNSMIRIGDCGDEYGNDYSMLNCEQGYTVDKYSESPNTCFPIYDKSGNILKGIDATLYIIKNSKIIPTVCLENADKQIYSNEYAKIERNITRGRNRCLLYYNDIINNKFDIIGTFNNDTVKLINSFIRLIQRDFMVYDVNIGASVEILNIHKKMTFYQSSEGSIYESGNFKLYFVDGKTINSDGDIIAYSSEPFKIDAAFGVIYNILINSNFEADGDIYTFTIDERGISDLVSIFLEDVNLDLLGINRGQMHIILEDDSIDRIEFDLDGKILKVIDANVSIDVDIDYNRKFKFPENIKKSLSLDKE